MRTCTSLRPRVLASGQRKRERLLTIVQAQLMCDKMPGVEANSDAYCDEEEHYCMQGDVTTCLGCRIHEIRHLPWRCRDYAMKFS